MSLYHDASELVEDAIRLSNQIETVSEGINSADDKLLELMEHLSGIDPESTTDDIETSINGAISMVGEIRSVLYG